MVKMKNIMYKLIGLLLLFIPYSSGADTRTVCMASYGLGNDNFGFGGDSFGGDGFGGENFGFGGMEADDFGGEAFGFGGMEADEFGGGFGEADEGFGGFAGGASVTGKLFCPKGNRGSILVKRIKFGASAFPGTCQSVPFCKEVFENGEKLAKKCNGGSTCSINSLQPKYLNCGRPSTYMLVEYECVDTWATFEICESVNTVARGASIIITSPGYLGTSSTGVSGVQMCECILRSNDGADMYMDYLQTQLSSQGDQCPYDFVLVESKKNINQTGIDKEIEVCGKQHVGGRWLQGAVRISYASGGPMKKQGLLARFTADNIGNKPMIELECGRVNTKGLKLLQTPPSKESNNNNRAMPFRPGFGMPMMPMMPQLPTPTASGPKPTWKIKIASDPPVARNQEPTLKVNLPMNTFLQQPSSNVAASPAAKDNSPVKKQPKQNNRNNRKQGRTQGGAGRRPPKKNNAGKVVADGESPVEKTKAENETSGGMVALVFAAIGAVLILGSVGILFLNNYRKRQRIKREEEIYASGGSASVTYGKGWEVASDSESIYATVADVDANREGCINPAVGTHDERERKASIKVESQPQSKSTGRINPSFQDDNDEIPDSYDKIVLKTQTESSDGSSKIAVIDVHQSFDAADEKLGNLHDENCLSSRNYAISKKATNRCDECNIVRPPRRKDTEREYSTGYDNNIGVTRHLK